MSSPLYDLFRQVIRKRKTIAASEAELAQFHQLDEIFLSSEVFVTTNVTEYYYAGTDQEHWYLTRHFPNLAPVFDAFWIETKAPTHIRSEEVGIQSWIENEDHYKRPRRWAGWFINLNPELVRKVTGATDYNPADNEWAYGITLFTQDDNENLLQPFWNFALRVNKSTGELVRDLSVPDYEGCLFNSEPCSETQRYIDTLEFLSGRKRLKLPTKSGGTTLVGQHEIMEAEAVGLLKPLLLAISFMHCGNVQRVPQYPSPKLNKKRQARNLPPQNKFHLLEIAPMKRILQLAADQYRGVRGASGIEMALHKCRGHFKTYTPEKPLFGHNVGRWFWAPTARGTARRGTVSKKYEVKTK